MATTKTLPKANLLGSARAENDKLLNTSFFESSEFTLLKQDNSRFVVVGRRGTGKSALFIKLAEEFERQRAFVKTIAPEEEEVLALRHYLSPIGAGFLHKRNVCKQLWMFAISMECVTFLRDFFKTKPILEISPEIRDAHDLWRKGGSDFMDRFRSLMKRVKALNLGETELLAELPDYLKLRSILGKLTAAFETLTRDMVLLVDRTDEGFEPDETGVAFIDGLIYAMSELKSRFKDRFKPIVFVRDNLFRALQDFDSDFSRNVEADALRLHWEANHLFYLACSRIRLALPGAEKIENNIKLWNRIAGYDLQGLDGFKLALKRTLYRPRDVLSLLNGAFVRATSFDRDTILLEDIDNCAKDFSRVRLADLTKEYAVVFPGVEQVISKFAGVKPELASEELHQMLAALVEDFNSAPAVQQQLQIVGVDGIARQLYSIGFVGIKDPANGTYVFCHDGKQGAPVLKAGSLYLVHPAYWPALNISVDGVDPVSAEQIYDEYEVKIYHEASEERAKAIGSLLSQLAKIDPGQEDAGKFEEWCFSALKICFLGPLRNFELRPNGSAPARRDIVATNYAVSGFWHRVLSDYKTRQVVFEVKNYESLGMSEFRQVASYLRDEYGSFAIIVCRDTVKELRRGGELDAFREFYARDRKLILKVTVSFLVHVLSKLRSPGKHDSADAALDKQVDTYIRTYGSRAA